MESLYDFRTVGDVEFLNLMAERGINSNHHDERGMLTYLRECEEGDRYNLIELRSIVHVPTEQVVGLIMIVLEVDWGIYIADFATRDGHSSPELLHGVGDYIRLMTPSHRRVYADYEPHERPTWDVIQIPSLEDFRLGVQRTQW
ncbi:hypothetical protein Xoosp14_70 [Xanthomonas phage Xoo-sp14]|nr:hypothetical protein Xoosp14_70 [Xanthomonas phage Xoo-sp14]